MSRLATSLASCLLLVGTTSLFAGPIPYGNPGSPAPLMTLTAMNTGHITGYFVNSSAGDTDSIALLDVTSGVMSSYFFSNHSTSAGATADFGSVTAGDHLVFVMLDSSTGTTLRSDAANPDGDPHSYMTAFSGGMLNGTTYPAGLYVGFEDRLVSQGSDLDYNDDNFIFTDVGATSATPEPGSLALMGTGALSAFGMLRRRFARA